MSGLLDFFQSASNSVASNVSAPVDGLAWLMRKLGAPIPSNPMGGSDWMEQKGLTKPVKQSGYSLAGETAGLISPMLAAAKAPQIARGLLQGADNLAAPRAMNPQAGKVFVYPQDKALATAQLNAAKSLDEGGLGLSANNTPAQRAQAMGFTDDGLLHGTKSDIREFNPSRGGEFGSGVYSAKDPGLANMFASFASGDVGENLMPLVSRAKNPLVTADRNIPRGLGTKGLAKKGFDSVEGIGATGQTQNVVIDPSMLRSRFAAFDPARRNEADILGRADPELLKLIAGGLLGYGGYNAAKDK